MNEIIDLSVFNTQKCISIGKINSDIVDFLTQKIPSLS